jgi:hypothetical protein
MGRWVRGCVLAAMFAFGSVGIASQKAIAPEVGRIHDGKAWSLVNADAEVEAGTGVVRLTPKGDLDAPGSHVGLALVEGVALGEGTLEIDLKGKGPEAASFLGVAFHAVDDQTFEAIYFRPFNFTRDGEKDGQPYRAHAVQYVAWPGNTWEKLRAETPGKFEAAVKPIPDPAGWFHARVEVTAKRVSVWVDDGKAPCLVVERLARRDSGKVGLWVDSRDGAFRNLKIRPAK